MSKKHKKNTVKLIPPVVSPVMASAFAPKQPKKVMEINGVSVYGSSAFLVSRIPNLSLRIDLSGLDLGNTQLVGGNEAAYSQLPHSLFATKVPSLSIDWADGTAHTLDVTWWETLIRAIEALPDGSSVAVCCVGGTGRTGTVLAILAGLTGQLGPDDTDPVKWMRDRYYDDAVESEEQMWYVEDITGLLTEAFPSDYLYRPATGPHGTQVLGIPTASHAAVADFSQPSRAPDITSYVKFELRTANSGPAVRGGSLHMASRRLLPTMWTEPERIAVASLAPWHSTWSTVW
ncbi:MAG: hypothetical protein IID38_08335 [Planctomycetes bacterium]|nr:hypothetical protein [Planctomycetota bacterium]